VKIVTGNLWSYYGREPYIVLITTNGTIKKNHQAVLGRGCAKEASIKIPGIARLLGAHLQNFGNVLMVTDKGYGTFPVKHEWWSEKADPALIVKSATDLAKMVEHPDFANKTWVLPRPGCGVGKLQWNEVRPLLEACGLPDTVWIISKGTF
jgi:hypothetical protein